MLLGGSSAQEEGDGRGVDASVGGGGKHVRTSAGKSRDSGSKSNGFVARGGCATVL